MSATDAPARAKGSARTAVTTPRSRMTALARAS